MMKTSKKLLPGMPGTKKLLNRYGEKLVCVRYKYDAQKQMRYKTVELIEEKSEWKKDSNRIPANKIMKVRVKYGEVDLGLAVKSLGGKWNKAKKYWELPYKDILTLGLEHRIIQDQKKLSNNRNLQPP